MWITILVMAVAISLEPFRIGMTVLMLNRPRPTLQLLAFLCGGFAMGISVGLAVLFVLQPRLLESEHFTLPKVQIAIGVLALLGSAVVATNVLAGRFGSRARGGATPGGVDGPKRLSTRVRNLLKGRSLWVAAVAGLGIALPSVDYLAALAVILASGTTATTQAGALLAFNVVAFALVEIPLAAYLVAPEKTRASMTALNDWIRSRRRHEVAALLAGVGCVLIVIGATGL
jgi:Sap, sulfolipid-1-addressing protein